MRDKGYTLLIDSMVALVLSLVVITGIMVLSQNVSNIHTNEYLEFLPLHYTAEDALDVMNKKGILDEVAYQWSLANLNTSSVHFKNASNISEDYLDQIVPEQMGYELTIEGQVLANRSSKYGGKSSQTHATRLLVGYAPNRTIIGETARASLKQIKQKITSEYIYFGGFVGQGNISRRLFLPSDAEVMRTYIEFNAASEFDLYANGNLCGHFTPSGGPMEANVQSFVNSTACPIDNTGNTPNVFSLNFTSDNVSNHYVGGGYIQVKYNTTEMNTDEKTGKMRFYFPEIKGIINHYSSFYVPGSVNSMEVNVTFRNNYTTFMTIGDKKIFEVNGTGSSQTVYNSSTELFTGSFSKSLVSAETVPIRLGTKGLEYSKEGEGGTADTVLITDVSGSMSGSKIDEAKDADKEFVEDVLNTSGNRVGLVSYEHSTDQTHDLSTDEESLKNEIDDYGAGGSTCIACGIESALQKHNTASSTINNKKIRSKSDWLYETSYPNSAPPDDTDGDSWYQEDYEESGWSSDDAILGFENSPYSPNVDTDIGSNAVLLGGNLLDYSTRTCQDVWGFDCGNGCPESGGDNTFDACDYGHGDEDNSVGGVTLNATSVKGNENVRITCDYDMDWDGNGNNYIYIFYRNSSTESWDLIYNDLVTDPGVGIFTRSTTLNVDNKTGVHQFRCSINEEGGFDTDGCVDNIGWDWDNDDVNLYVNRRNLSADYYFRKHFSITNASNIQSASLKELSDDMADIYVNGNQIHSASSRHNAEYWNNEVSFNENLLHDGDNVVAVKLHNNDNLSAKFDLQLKVEEPLSSPSDRMKSMLVMSDGKANVELSSWSPDYSHGDSTSWDCDSGADDACDDAIRKGCDARNDNITVYSVGFGSGADENTLKKIACWNCSSDSWIGNVTLSNGTTKNCRDARYYYADTGNIADIYQQIAGKLINASLVSQKLVLSGTVSDLSNMTVARLYSPESYIEFNYDEPNVSQYGTISITNKSQRFNDPVDCTGEVDISSNVTVSEMKVTSYSGEHWTDLVNITSSIFAGVPPEYRLWDYSSPYSELGDPYVVNIGDPWNKVATGETNYIGIRTGDSETNATNCSADNRAIYTVRVPTIVGYGGVFPNNEGCVWNIEFENTGVVNDIPIPDYYAGSNRCNYTSSNRTYVQDDAAADAAYRLFKSLDTGDDGIVDVDFDSDAVEFDASSTGGIRSLWGPVRVRLVLWV